MNSGTSARELGRLADQAVREARALRQAIRDGGDDAYRQAADALRNALAAIRYTREGADPRQRERTEQHLTFLLGRDKWDKELRSFYDARARAFGFTVYPVPRNRRSEPDEFMTLAAYDPAALRQARRMVADPAMRLRVTREEPAGQDNRWHRIYVAPVGESGEARLQREYDEHMARREAAVLDGEA
jgi:hypothetical protein